MSRGNRSTNPWNLLRMPDNFKTLESTHNEICCFNFGKVLTLSQKTRELTTIDCVKWIINCYLPLINGVNDNSSSKHKITIQEIMFKFLLGYHTKHKNAITDDQFLSLLNFDAKSSSIENINDNSIDGQTPKEINSGSVNNMNRFGFEAKSANRASAVQLLYLYSFAGPPL